MSMIGISLHLIGRSLISRSGGLFLTPTRSLTCSIIRSLVIVTINGLRGDNSESERPAERQ